MTREELIKRIALKMDEISSSDDVIVPVGTGDNNPLYAQIDGLLNESVNDALMKAPIYRIHCQIASIDSFREETLFDGSRKSLVCLVPDDFIRLVSVTDDYFQRPIVDLAIEGDDIDKRQHNKFLVAKCAKPVAVLGRNESGKRIITCYSFDTNDMPNPSLNYIKRYSNDGDLQQDTELDEYMTELVSWVCAGKVFAAHGDINRGKICDENASAIMI